MSCAKKDIEMVSLQIHNGVVRKLDEVQYIPKFKNNLISLSRLDSNSYRWRAEDEILKVICGNRVVMKEKREDITYWQRAQHEVKLQKPMKAQNEVDLLVQVDQIWGGRLRRITDDVTGWSFYHHRRLSQVYLKSDKTQYMIKMRLNSLIWLPYLSIHEQLVYVPRHGGEIIRSSQSWVEGECRVKVEIIEFWHLEFDAQ